MVFLVDSFFQGGASWVEVGWVEAAGVPRKSNISYLGKRPQFILEILVTLKVYNHVRDPSIIPNIFLIMDIGLSGYGFGTLSLEIADISSEWKPQPSVSHMSLKSLRSCPCRTGKKRALPASVVWAHSVWLRA